MSLKASFPESLFSEARKVTGLQPAPKVLAQMLFSSEFSETSNFLQISDAVVFK